MTMMTRVTKGGFSVQSLKQTFSSSLSVNASHPCPMLHHKLPLAYRKSVVFGANFGVEFVMNLVTKLTAAMIIMMVILMIMMTKMTEKCADCIVPTCVGRAHKEKKVSGTEYHHQHQHRYHHHHGPIFMRVFTIFSPPYKTIKVQVVSRHVCHQRKIPNCQKCF